MPSASECAPLIMPRAPGEEPVWEGMDEEEYEAWEDETYRDCSQQLHVRASLILDLFHAGDCDGLAALPVNSRLRRGEQALIGFMLADLGDARGLQIFLESFDLYENRLMDPVRDHLPDSECGHLKAWWAPEAAGTCRRYRWDGRELCAPAHCQYAHGLLIYAATQRWPGAAEALLEQTGDSQGEEMIQYCYCGIRSPSTDPGYWYNAAANDAEREWMTSCLGAGPVDPRYSGCATMMPREERRRCGEASGRDVVLQQRREQARGRAQQH